MTSNLLSLKNISLVIFLITIFYFYNNLIKRNFSFKLSVVTKSMETVLKEHDSLIQKKFIFQNALPILNKYKNQILKHHGYWPDIFNTYNQIAVVEYFNGDKRAAIRFLLNSIHYHPYLSETYIALAKYLNQIDKPDIAKNCLKFADQLLNHDNIDLNYKSMCLEQTISTVN